MTETNRTTPPFGLASTDGLGQLPPCARVVEYNAAKGYSFDAYTAEQMLAYRAAGVAAERERAAEIVRNAAAAHGLCCADCVALADLIEGLSVERVALTDAQHRALICDGVVQIGA